MISRPAPAGTAEADAGKRSRASVFGGCGHAV
jgi:hypothetical protein